jgi:hypothetical protein
MYEQAKKKWITVEWIYFKKDVISAIARLFPDAIKAFRHKQRLQQQQQQHYHHHHHQHQQQQQQQIQEKMKNINSVLSSEKQSDVRESSSTNAIPLLSSSQVSPSTLSTSLSSLFSSSINSNSPNSISAPSKSECNTNLSPELSNDKCAVLKKRKNNEMSHHHNEEKNESTPSKKQKKTFLSTDKEETTEEFDLNTSDSTDQNLLTHSAITKEVSTLEMRDPSTRHNETRQPRIKLAPILKATPFSKPITDPIQILEYIHSGQFFSLPNY